MSRLRALLRAVTLTDAFVTFSLLALVVALLYPTWSARAFREDVANAVADVEAVVSAARESHARQGQWPRSGPAGEPPPELGVLGGPDGPFSRAGYTLAWTSWQVVDSVPAPPDPGPPPSPGDPPRASASPLMLPVTRTVGAVAVQSAEDALLVELLRHYGSGASFVLDSLWLLVLGERAEARAR